MAFITHLVPNLNSGYALEEMRLRRELDVAGRGRRAGLQNLPATSDSTSMRPSSKSSTVA